MPSLGCERWKAPEGSDGDDIKQGSVRYSGLPGFCPSVQPAKPVETSWTRHPREEIGTLGFIRNFTVCGFDALRSVNRYK